ncbi:MAG: glutamate--cysteine ligase [Proteobacteria bacterium]|nr:glutamate--cysteine ligase [Pseudomonadota bacterium]
MYSIAEQRLSRLVDSGTGDLLVSGQVGLEKESLRVMSDGNLAQTRHPRALGSSLTHPYITTDYSEALAEFITPPSDSIPAVLDFLRDTQCFVYENLGDEFLWATSMPCVVAGETSIPIAEYGSSNPGLMKTVYRRGLGHRYGRLMQIIAGVHFNYSFADAFWPAFQEIEKDSRPLQDFTADSYFALIRNLQRFGWLVPYLFGASPAVCKSFLGGAETNLDTFDASTYYEPYATSLRMGDIGYQNNKEAKTGVKVCYDNLDAYVTSLSQAIETPCPEYEKLGVVVKGRYEQLNANILQIENEYYSTIRPKQIVDAFEKPVHALKQRGVRYVELRSIDVNAFEPLGINERQLRFLEAFLIFCQLHESPVIGAKEGEHIDRNELVAAHRGRDPRLLLYRGDEKILLRDWAREIISAMTGVCELLDKDLPGKPYSASLAAQQEKAQDADFTPSARMLEAMRREGEGFFHFALRKSQQHQAYFRSLDLDPERREMFNRLTGESLARQQTMEADNDESFSDYLQRYFSQ